MPKYLYFLNRKYKCNDQRSIIKPYSLRKKNVGIVSLGSERKIALVCLCGCRLTSCDDRLFVITIDNNHIEGNVLKYYKEVNNKGFKKIKKKFLEYVGTDILETEIYDCIKKI